MGAPSQERAESWKRPVRYVVKRTDDIRILRGIRTCGVGLECC
jgi:hypothetical protein